MKSFFSNKHFLDWKGSSALFWSAVTLVSLLVATTIYPSVLGTAGYNDEAWLVLLVQNQANGFATFFSHYYRFMSNWGLVGMRIGVAVTHAIACVVFVYGVERYYHPFEKLRCWGLFGLWCICALVPQVFWLGGIVLAPDYKFIAYDAA